MQHTAFRDRTRQLVELCNRKPGRALIALAASGLILGMFIASITHFSPFTQVCIELLCTAAGLWAMAAIVLLHRRRARPRAQSASVPTAIAWLDREMDQYLHPRRRALRLALKTLKRVLRLMNEMLEHQGRIYVEPMVQSFDDDPKRDQDS